MKVIFEKLKSSLVKTKNGFVKQVLEAAGLYQKVSPKLLEKLEEVFLQADIGPGATSKILATLKEKAKNEKLDQPDKIISYLKSEIVNLLNSARTDFSAENNISPRVIMTVGVNGTGKTTSIGKLANYYKQQNKKVLIVACDTFRAAAGEQLEIWANRAKAELVKSMPGSDPAAVAYDGVKAALARKMDIVILDTAGRLHTKINLMEELKKIKRTIAKVCPTAPNEVLLVMDATTGQNGIPQAKLFTEAVGVTGIFLTKLDGTAKGGVVIAIADQLKILVKYVGTGETLEDISEFDSNSFVEALFYA